MTLNIEKENSFYNPHLLSEKSDLLKLSGENRLRALAKTIPSYGHHQLHSATQSCISATIHATYEYLSQIISGLSLTNPNLARFMVVSASGLDAINWLERTKDNQHGWIPNFPVSGFISFGMLKKPPTYGVGPFEPAIHLLVNRRDDNSEDFALEFTVSEPEHMRFLSMLFNDAGDLWDKFESTFSVTPSTPIPLPDDAAIPSGTEESCREYLSAFIKHVVENADDEVDCLESFDLQFLVKNTSPLHGPIVAAIALFEAYSLYLHSPNVFDHDARRFLLHQMLTTAINTGITTQLNENEENAL